MKITQKQIIAQSEKPAKLRHYHSLACTEITATIGGTVATFDFRGSYAKPRARRTLLSAFIRLAPNGATVQSPCLIGKIDAAAIRLSKRFPGLTVFGWRGVWKDGKPERTRAAYRKTNLP